MIAAGSPRMHTGFVSDHFCLTDLLDYVAIVKNYAQAK